MKWRKEKGDIWKAEAGPYHLKVDPKGDGRWNWSVVDGDKPNPEAAGVRMNVNGAKSAAEALVARSGRT
ncbi:MAG: hypothetical protein JWP97_4542 [Labilithrix sp.]|nr:hypothetical protein [Labilithrix sp.]